MKNSSPTSRGLQAATVAALLLAAVPSGRAASYLWNVASPGANSWNVNANWSPVGIPGAADTALFGDLGVSPDAVTVNNVVGASAMVTALNYTNVAVSSWNVTQIPAGVTLSVSNLNVGLTAATGGNAPGLTTSAAVFDAGTLSVSGNLTVGNGSSASGSDGSATLDLSGLSNFVFNASSGTIQLSTVNRTAANLKFAATSNYVTAGTMNLNTASGSSSKTGTVTLGAGTNILNVGTVSAALARNSCTIQFPTTSGPEAGLRVRGVTGAESRATLTLANRTASGSGGTDTGKLLLDGHPVDIKLGTLTLGQGGATGTGAGNIGSGLLSFDTGTLDATAINMAIVTSFSNCNANATLTVGAGGTLIVGSGGLSLANLLAGAPTTPTGTLTVNGGTVICSNSITKANPGGTATLTMNGGALNMVTGVVGTASVPMDALNLYGAALTLAVAQNTTNVVATSLNASGSTINISSLPTILSYPAQFTLMQFGGGYSDSLLGSLPPGYAGNLVNNSTTVDLVLTSGPGPAFQLLAWNGNLSTNWDTATANWQGAKIYAQNDYVRFDDTASGNSNVNLTMNLTPGLLTVSNVTKNYTFNGPGALGGAVALNKDGAGTLTISNSGVNTFSNGVSILGGTLQLGGSDNRLPAASVVTLADVPGVTLDLNNLNQTIQSLYGGGANGGEVQLGSGTLTDVGGGTYGGVISGTGRLIKTNLTTGGTLTLTNANTYGGGTIVGGYTNNTTLVVANQTGSGTGTNFVRVLANGTFSLGNGGPGGSVAAGVLTNDGTVRLNRSDDFTFTNTLVGAGILDKQNTNTVTITVANAHAGGTTINGPTTVLSPSILRISNPAALGSGIVDIGNRGTLQLSGGITLLNPMLVGAKPSTTVVGSPNVENRSGSNTLAGNMQLTQNGAQGWIFMATADHLLVSGAMTPLNGSQTSQNTTRTLWLRGDAVGEWSSSIIDPVGGTTNLALRKDGLGTWTLSGANTYIGPTVVSNGTLLVNGSLSASSTVTVAGGTLGGTGTIAAPVTVNAAGVLAPGASLGGLTINNSLTLSGTTVMEVSHAATDRVVGLGTVTLGGTLQIVVQGTLSGGEIFKLFSATNYTGDFATYDLPTLTPPLGWDFSKVAVDGTLRVTGGTLTPPTLQVSQSGSQLTFAWNSASFKLQAQTNSLSTGISGNWTDYPGGGYSPVTIPIQSADPAVFFRLTSQ